MAKDSVALIAKAKQRLAPEAKRRHRFALSREGKADHCEGEAKQDKAKAKQFKE